MAFEKYFPSRKWTRPTIQGECDIEIKSDYSVELTFWSEPSCRYRVIGKVFIYWNSPDKGTFSFYSLINVIKNDKIESFSVPFYIERGDLYDFDGGYHIERYVLEKDPIPMRVRQEKVYYYPCVNYDYLSYDESDDSYSEDLQKLKRSNSLPSILPRIIEDRTRCRIRSWLPRKNPIYKWI